MKNTPPGELRQMMTKAVQKALDFGWEMNGKDRNDWKVGREFSIETYRTNDNPIHLHGKWVNELVPVKIKFHQYIYDHDFHKALWGYEMIEGYPAWQYHLMHMVISSSKLDYIDVNLN